MKLKLVSKIVAQLVLVYGVYEAFGLVRWLLNKPEDVAVFAASVVAILSIWLFALLTFSVWSKKHEKHQ